MLSAFTARPIVELKQRDKSKIETILAYGDRVLVGLNTGSLRIYRLNELFPSGGGNGNGNGNGNGSTTGSTTGSGDGNGAHGDDGDGDGDANTPSAARATDLLREVEKFSTRSVDQLAIIREANILVSLSNYHVSLHDLKTYELLETLSRTKNASSFAVTSNVVKNPATAIPEIISRLAVPVKRRLLLWTWHESELHHDITEIVLPEAIRTVTWATATKLVCGMNAGYVLVDVTTAHVQDISATGAAAAAAGQGSRFGAASMGYMGLGGYMPKPLATRLAGGEMLLAKDIHSLFIDVDGKPLDKRQIPWQAAPESIGYSYPYILALQPPAKGSLEVRNPDTLSLLQTVDLPGAAQLHFLPPSVSLAHTSKGFHISSDRVVWKMDATDYDTQVRELVDKRKFDEAISILGMLEDALLKDKTGTMREVKMLKAESLFKQKKFRESLDLFNEDEVHAPPERVLRLYPRMIAGELSAEAEELTETFEPEAQGEDDGASGAKGFKRASVVEAASPSKPTGFARYWIGHRKTDSDAASVTSSTKAVTEQDETASVKPKATASIEENGPLEAKDLLNALRELTSYLAGTRARLQRLIDPSTGKLKSRQSTFNTTQSSITDNSVDALLSHPHSESDEQLEKELRDTFTLVDTTLFRSYMYSKPALAGSLFRIPNFCDPTVVNEKLLEHSRYNELVDFFYGKKLHREALELLRRFGDTDEIIASGNNDATGEITNPGHDGEKDIDKNNNDDKDNNSVNEGINSHSAVKIPDQLRGPRRTVGYLQSLPPDMVDLILEFVGWVLRRDPDLGMEVFVADSENAETLPRERVVKYLSDLDRGLEIRYLEHIISELGDVTPDFHNRLVELQVRRLRDETDPNAADWSARMERLVAFLKESRQYSLTRAFGMIPRDDANFYEAQAVVLSNMGQHKQALEIYVFKMEDYAKAEEYCNRIHKQQTTDASSPSSPTSRRDFASSPAGAGAQTVDPDDPDAEPSIYHTLLSLYLTPPAPHGPRLEPALALLSRHGSRLPASSTLSLIPDDLSVARLESYFRGRVRAANSLMTEARVVEGLRKTQLVNTEAALLLGMDGTMAETGAPGRGGRNRRVLVSEERVCGVCHKRLGNSVAAVLPDNTVVHYGCLARKTTAGVGSGAGTGTGIGVIGAGPGAAGRVAGAWGRHG